MTENDNQPTREKIREFALEYLNDEGFNSLALAYASKDGYGPRGVDAVRNFKYKTAMKEGGLVGEYLADVLEKSGVEGEPYSGNLNEMQLIGTAFQTLMNSATQVKVSDIAEKIGYDINNIPEPYRNSYMQDLLKEDASDEEKKIGNELMRGYQQVFVDKGVAEALNARANAIPGNLERILNPEPSA